jgi:hypothetical protein
VSVKTIAIDFDGVLHKYSKGWRNGEIYDEPMEGAVGACKLLIERGYNLVVFTVRKNTRAVEEWLRKNGFPEMKVTNQKPKAVAYIDDRGIRFQSWGQAMIALSVLEKGNWGKR